MKMFVLSNLRKAVEESKGFRYDAECGVSFVIPGKVLKRWRSTAATPAMIVAVAAQAGCTSEDLLSRVKAKGSSWATTLAGAAPSILEIIMEVMIPMLPVLLPIILESVSPSDSGEESGPEEFVVVDGTQVLIPVN